MEEIIKKIQSLREKIEKIWSILKIDEQILEKKQIEKKMTVSDFWKNPEEAKKISQNYEKICSTVKNWQDLVDELDSLYIFASEIEKTKDLNLEKQLEEQFFLLEKKISEKEFLILMSDLHDRKNVILSIHAGSGGTDAQDWAEILMRMYLRYAEKKKWKVYILDETKAGEAGIKTVVMRIEGDFAYGYLKGEQGTHRLVRISPFDGEAMRHTSFALVEILPEIESEEMEIDEKDLRIDTFLAGGHGGQSVNTTYSAVRIVHLPTNIVVSCQNERSQLQNRLTALKILKSKLQKIKELEEEAKTLKLKGEYRIPEWGSQIRSYVLNPYKLVKDLRSNWETTDVENILNGNLDEMIMSVIKFFREIKK